MKIVAIALSIALFAGSAFAQEAGGEGAERSFGGDRIWIEFVGGMAIADGGAFDTAILGMQAAWIFPVGIGVELDVYYSGTDYYLYEGGSWSGPTSWSNIAAAYPGLSPAEWGFYETKLLFALSASIRYALDRSWYLHLAVGPAITAIVPSEAFDYYPEFVESFENADRSNVFVGWIVKTGVRFVEGPFAIGFDYIFDVKSPEDFATGIAVDGFDYFLRSGNFSLTLGVAL